MAEESSGTKIRNFFKRFDKRERGERTETTIVEKEITDNKKNGKEAVLKPEEIKKIRTGKADGWH